MLEDNEKKKKSIKNREIIKNNSSPHFLSQIYEKEDFLQDIRTIREYCKEKINKFSSFMKELNIKIDSKIEIIEKNQNKLIELYVDLKRKTEIIEEIQLFKTKIEEETYTQKIKLEDLKKELNDISFKYDKIYIDNFKFPGLIGDKESRFKNFKEYIFFQIETTDNLNFEKNEQINVTKQLERRFEENISFLVKQIEKSEKISKLYVDNNKKYLENIINNIPKEFYSKIEDLKIENHKYAIKLLNKCDSLSELKDKLNHLSIVMEKRVDEYQEIFEKMKHERNEKIDFVMNKINNNDKIINEIKNDIQKKYFDDGFIQKFNDINDEISNIKKTLRNLEISDLNIENKNTINVKNSKKEKIEINKINDVKNNIYENITNQLNDDLLIIKQNIEKKYSKFQEKIEELEKNLRKDRLILEEKLNNKILNINDQVRNSLSSKEKIINNFSDKINIFEKSLYENKKLIKELNLKISKLENLIIDKKIINEEIEKLKKENIFINLSMKRFDNTFMKFSQDYKELELITNGILEREKNQKNMKNFFFPLNKQKSLQYHDNYLGNSYAAQTTREFFNNNNSQKQNYYSLNSFEKNNIPSDEIRNNNFKLKKTFSSPRFKSKQKNISNNNNNNNNNKNDFSPIKNRESHSLSKLRDETVSSRQKRLKLYSLKEIIQKLPDCTIGDEEEEKSKKLLEQIPKKET